jgi:hypothetical protein
MPIEQKINLTNRNKIDSKILADQPKQNYLKDLADQMINILQLHLLRQQCPRRE